jgi:activator of HSP90 ATPase
MAPIKVRNLEQTATIRATPAELYRTLVNPKEHAKFTGAPAKLEAKPGGRFEHYDGSLQGRVVELVPNERIVLAWRSSGWPKGHHSIAQFRFVKAGKGTRLEFSQYGIPENDFADIRQGWTTYYWEPLQRYFEETA